MPMMQFQCSKKLMVPWELLDEKRLIRMKSFLPNKQRPEHIIQRRG